MTANKTLMWLLGGVAGMVAAAIVIGLALVGVAIATSWGSASATLQHPLFGSGSDLVRTGCLAALPLLAWWLIGRKPQRAGKRPE